MDPASALKWLKLIAERAPCDVAHLTSRREAFRLPISADPERKMGPPPMPHEKLSDYRERQQELRAKGFVEIAATGLPLNETEKNEIFLLADQRLIRVKWRPSIGSFEAVSPIGKANFRPRVLGLTTRGIEFLTLSSDQKRYANALDLLSRVNAVTFSNLLSELRALARSDIAEARKELQ